MWLSFLRPGDLFLIFLALFGTALSFPILWLGGAGDRLVIRQEGAIFLEVDLQTPREISVPGPLGETRVVVEKGRARVAADPGPRQYCVRQGWLSRAGEVAICAPNRVSLVITGKDAPYDSLNY
ncbi:MAG: NusG domain II-containing protein [Zoogloeaceae bacterium]|jgi:hypothetical protein|nr:NusG domain II-containing protein [Zoogloeaceae bacterium]